MFIRTFLNSPLELIFLVLQSLITPRATLLGMFESKVRTASYLIVPSVVGEEPVAFLGEVQSLLSKSRFDDKD